MNDYTNHTKSFAERLKRVALLCLISGGLVFLNAPISRAEMALTGSHRIVSSQSSGNEFIITLEFSILGANTALSVVSLESVGPAPGLIPITTPLSIVSLPAESNTITQWIITTILPPEVIFTGQPLIFHGDAADPLGNMLTITLLSEEGVQE